jgi:Holliday junction resolvase RusA-like endonuclease
MSVRAASLFASTEVETVSFVCVGTPQPAGSKTAFRDPRTDRVIVKDDNPKTKPWKKAVAKSALPAMTGRPLLDGPVSILIVFFLDRPKGHYGTGRNAERVKDFAPARPIVRPDVLKLARAVEDALTGVAYEDDAQIVREHLEKHYGSPARVVVEITPLED